MADKLTWDEIKQKYPDEWVVLVDFKIEGVAPAEGVVIDHGPVRDEVYDRLDKGPRSCAVWYTGEIRGGLFGFYGEDEDLERKGQP
jgi:hypothetical protein